MSLIYKNNGSRTVIARSQRRRGNPVIIVWIASLALAMTFTPAQANVLDWRLWDADGKLKVEKFSEAKDEYLKIQVTEPDNARLNYNLGIANYREGAMTQALNSFQLASVQSKDKEFQHKAFHNLGNSQFKLEDYKSAISSYELALELDSNDEDTKHNLELAKKKLEEQKQDKKDDQNKDGDKDKDDESDKDDQNKDGDQGKDDQNKDKDDKQDQQNKPKPQNQPQKQNGKQDQTKPGGLSQQDIERMLMQVEEADPSEVNQNRAEAQGSGPNKHLKPW